MRTTLIAALLTFAVATAYAADDSLDKAAKKTGDGFGNLLKGMGQEVKKTGIGNDGKKDDKKASKTADGRTKENPK